MSDIKAEQPTSAETHDESIANTPEDVDKDVTIDDCDDGYELDELKEVVHGILWDILDQRRPLLRDLIAAKRLIDFPPPKPKAGSKKAKEPDPDGNALLDKVIETILDIDEELKNVDNDILREQLFILCDNPPPLPPSLLQLVLLKKTEDGVTFQYHEIISTVLQYLDMKSLLLFSETSKICNEAVNAYARKAAYNLPLHSGSICSNLNYWRHTIEFFFSDKVTMKPISRSNYTPIQAQLRMNKTIFPINEEAMQSHTYVSYDYIKPHYIVYCDHMKPMAHTCSASRAIDCDNKALSRVITLSEFIMEYGRRLEIKDASSPAWGVPASMVTPAYVCFLLKVTLDTISKCIKKHAGLVEYRRTEYTANATHHITHRIWLQVSLQWDFRFGDNAQNSLYLNIADHFRWDG